ncbi:MAG TPA: hypothetical protein PL078_02725 [Bacillota bacterium]|jgi:predicted nucleic acid-binding Zn ribbon protein|nr:hypothetical protein [Peptococcaceae bacterium MAG4]NLW37923.1 hypothetical protein [Peptococcaceae bacterium]HPU35159.1 hypothetical protein [Bacillota bacterium]HPZ42895.1 hypothetical protein [Bacillota bacterium]HQD75412.1 hypothetical protein [Bacillota bacterium]
MSAEKTGNNREMVLALADTIQKRILGPAEEKAELLNVEIRKMNELVAGLEQKQLLLAAEQRRTKLMAMLGMLGIVILLALQIVFYLR